LILDTLYPALAGESEMIQDMARKSYSEEFRRQAVDLYESTPGATLRGIAADLGIVRGTLSEWVRAHGTGRKTAADGSTVPSEVGPARAGVVDVGRDGAPLTPEQRIARLEAENARLRAETTKLTTEREILRQAAKYFAGETNW
jgi:transposase